MKPLLRGLKSSYALNAFSLVVGLIALALAPLSLRNPRPGITYEIVDESNAPDVLKHLHSLVIMYQGQRIPMTTLNLKVITLKIANTGDTDILQAHFDDRRPWGFRVTAGQVIDLQVIKASSAYVSQAVAPEATDAARVTFRRIMFDRGAYVVMQVVVLHPRNLHPGIIAEGKIVGIDGISVARTPSASVGALMRAFGGDGVIQGLRLGLYGGAFLILFYTAFAAAEQVAKRDRRIQTGRRTVSIEAAFRDADMPMSTKAFVRDAYLEAGSSGVRSASDLLDEADKLQAAVVSYEGRKLAHEKLLAKSGGVVGVLLRHGIVSRGPDGHVTVDRKSADDLSRIIPKLPEK